MSELKLKLEHSFAMLFILSFSRPSFRIPLWLLRRGSLPLDPDIAHRILRPLVRRVYCVLHAVFLRACCPSQASLPEFCTFLFYRFGGKKTFGLIFTALYGCLVYSLLTPGIVPSELLWWGQAANIPMVVIGKLIQVFTNFGNGHTGQLSAVTVFMLAAGSLARIFTSIQETGDRIVILTYVCSSAVNCILALQVLYYWNATKAANEKKKKKRA